MVICLEQGAELHIAQLMPLPLTVFSKIQIGFTQLVPAHLNVCVCVSGFWNTVYIPTVERGSLQDKVIAHHVAGWWNCLLSAVECLCVIRPVRWRSSVMSVSVCLSVDLSALLSSLHSLAYLRNRMHVKNIVIV